MIQRAELLARRTANVQREESAIVTAFTEANGAYVVLYRGATVSPVWSQNGVRYSVGAVVKVLVVGNIVKAIIP